jgi:hypothetical protein
MASTVKWRASPCASIGGRGNGSAPLDLFVAALIDPGITIGQGGLGPL